MKKILIGTLLSIMLTGLTFFVWTGRSTGSAALASPKAATDVERIDELLGDMKTAELDKLPALAVKPFEIPRASVDVMRARLEETYEIDGVGRDTVQLSGWIAAKIDDAHPMEGEKEVRWGTAISDTEFIGMELRGESAKFGPVIVTINKDMPSKGQVGALEFSLGEALALNRTYSKYRQPSPYENVAGEAATTVETGEPTEPAAVAATVDEKAITRVMNNLWASLERKDVAGYTKDFAADFDYEGSAAPDSNVKTKKQFVDDLNQQLANVQSMKVNASAPKIRVFGRLATVSASGTNTVVQKEGESGDTPWRATAQLKKVGSKWLLVQNQVRFRQIEASTDKPLSQGELRKRASACRASLSIDVYMPKLDLHMKAGQPVVWYSEVQTIPPVGYTASVSLTPTPMLSGGRQVATLEHGAVKFREIVRHVALQGARQDQSAAR
jgi:hypothetical protein